jgi:putative ABC transport system permease protein
MKQPGFSALAILTLALGIGVNVAIFSALEALVIHPLPFPHADQLVAVYEDASWLGYAKNTPAPANFMDWKQQTKTLRDISATRGCRAVLTGENSPEEVLCRNFTANTWPLLAVNPILGRWFNAQEDHPKPDVAVIGEGLWTRRFGRDPAILQRPIQINGQAVRVVGVMPEWFHLGGETELWMPAGFTSEDLAKRGSHYLSCYGRLNPGVTAKQAEAELRAIQTRINRTYPADTDPRMSVAVEPLRDALVGDTRFTLWILMGAAGMVLLIACFNVANLLLARATGRQRELAVRRALGASTFSLFVHVFAETLVLTAAGGTVGVFLAFSSRTLLENFIPSALKGSVVIQLDAGVLAFTLLACVLVAAIASVTPLFHVLRVPLVNVLRQDSRTGSSRGAVRLRGFLVVAEVTLTVMLLVGAGLMIRSLMAIWQTHLGFRPEKLLVVRVSVLGAKYADDQARATFYDRALENIHAIPGVSAADYVSTPPFFSIGDSTGFAIEGRTPANQWEKSDMLTRVASPGYLQTLGATLLTGRFFNAGDREAAPDVAIVNETFAKTYFPNQSAIGKRMSLSGEKENERRWRTIVGVVKEIKERGFDYAPKPVTYVIVRQTPSWYANQVVVRSEREAPLRLIPSIRKAIQAVDPDQPLGRARTFDEILAINQANRRQQMFLLAAFAGLSLVMACLGIYAILAFTVELRRREIGVRLALGAGRNDVIRLVALDGIRLAATGGLLGTLLAAALARVLYSSLYGVRAFDPITWASVCAVLALVALIACVVPARRAAATSPSIALRAD